MALVIGGVVVAFMGCMVVVLLMALMAGEVDMLLVAFVRAVRGFRRTGGAGRMVVDMFRFCGLLCRGGVVVAGRTTCAALQYGERYRRRYQYDIFHGN